MSLHYVRSCEMCGKAYISAQKRGMYCGAVCKDRAYRGMHLEDKTCPVCGTVFRTFDRRQHFCSAACRDEAKRARRGIQERTCIICGKPLPRRPGGHKTCSQECLKENERRQKNKWAKMDWQRKKAAKALQPPVMYDKTCQECGAVFHTGSRTQLYCSARCRNKVKHKKRTERAIYELVCHACGKEFRAQRPTQKYCSKSCAMKWQHAIGIAPCKGRHKPNVFVDACAATDDDDMIYGNMIYL